MSLFDGWDTLDPPYQRRSRTSRDAAASVRLLTPSLRERVLRVLRTCPMTDSQLAIHLQLSENSVRPRRVELAGLGLVVPVGETQGPSGRKATVWGGVGEQDPQ